MSMPVINVKATRLFSSMEQNNSQLPVLYSFRRCPYAMRARMALVYSGVQCVLREVELKNKPQSLLEYSPKGTVPVMVLPDGSIVEESLDLVNYALNFNDPSGLLAVNDEVSKDIESLIDKNDTDFVKWLTRYKYFERFPEQSQTEYLNIIQENYFNNFETRLSSHSYIAADQRTKADIVLVPFVRQFALADKEYFYNSKYTKIIAWLDEFLSEPNFEIVMQKHKPWQEGDEEILLLP